MMVVKPEHYFWLNDGRVIKDIDELAKALEKMHDDIFNHHVTDNRNDFANWIRDVIKDKGLAKKIAASRTKADAHKHVRYNLNKKQLKEKRKEVKEIIKKPLIKKTKTIKTSKKTTPKKIKPVKKKPLPKIIKKKSSEKQEPEMIKHHNPQFDLSKPLHKAVFWIVLGIAAIIIIVNYIR